METLLHTRSLNGVHHRRLAGPLEIVIAYFNINSLFFMLA